jgi:hypothetical protein
MPIARTDYASIMQFIKAREFDHVPEVLVRQVNEYGSIKARGQSVLLRQLRERTEDLKACEKIAETITNEAWGMF